MKKARAKSASVPVTPKIVSVAIPANFGTRKKSQDEWNIGTDFKYAVEYEIDEQLGYDHNECDGICRCRQISGVRIKEADPETIASTIMCHKPHSFKIPKDLKPYFDYALNRIVTHSGACDVSQWNASVCRGYYGEEVDQITLAAEPLGRIVAGLSHLVNGVGCAKPIEIFMEAALLAEYGYMLEGLDSAGWQIVHIKPEEVYFPKAGHYMRTNPRTVQDYKQNRDRWPHPVAVVMRDPENKYIYRLIDGRHRFLANQDKKKIRVLLATDSRW